MLKRYAGAIDDCFDDLNGVTRTCSVCKSQFTEDDAAEDGAAHARIVLEISRLGARVEAMLDRLGMAPSARPALPKTGEPGVDLETRTLVALRSDAATGAPASGIDYTSGVDPAVEEADTED